MVGVLRVEEFVGVSIVCQDRLKDSSVKLRGHTITRHNIGRFLHGDSELLMALIAPSRAQEGFECRSGHV